MHTQSKSVLIAGASFAGLSMAHWMKKMGHRVTVAETAPHLKKGGTPVNIENDTVSIVKRMGLFDDIRANRLHMETVEFKNADDVTEGSMPLGPDEAADAQENCEIERDTLLGLLFETVKDDVEFVFGNGVVGLAEADEAVQVSFRDGSQRRFDLVFGCDGVHSSVRKSWFGNEANYAKFLEQYFSITVVDKLLIRENTTQMYSVPGKTVMLNAYKRKTEIVLCFFSEKEIPYDYRDEAQQRRIIVEQFEGEGWRTPELLDEVRRSQTFYFDKLSQIHMPSWTKGRVALVGDAACCASPAAGMGGSLAIVGAAALAEAFERHGDDHEAAFQSYQHALRPFVEEVQDNAVQFGLEMLVPRTEEAIRRRNTQSETLGVLNAR